MEYCIRNADINDANVLGNIHSESFRVAYKGIIPDSILDNFTAIKREQYIQKSLIDGTEEYVLIEKCNEPAGFICIGKCRDEDLDSSCGEVWGIYLLPLFWNQGLGTKLINWGMAELIRRGFEKVSLWVLEENINARKFYEKLGFEHDGTVKEINIGKPLNEYRYIRNCCSTAVLNIFEGS
jgi:ribosomal protein S18 acetylase RimI-like enzyme